MESSDKFDTLNLRQVLKNDNIEETDVEADNGQEDGLEIDEIDIN